MQLMKALSETEIIHRLGEAYHTSAEPSRLWEFLSDAPRPAAVLIPLFHFPPAEEHDSGWQVLLTRRTNSVAEHQGQVAFPGGRADPTDTTAQMTALREAHEEVGLDPTRVRILGRMDSMWTISNYLVTPIVGLIPWPFPVRLEETEVSRVFSIPLDWLAEPEHHEIHYRTIPNPIAERLHRDKFPVIYFQPYDGEILWGVSADITLRLIDILYDKNWWAEAHPPIRS